MVTAGAQHALTLLLRLLAGPGDRVLVEHPTYPNALDAIRAIGAPAGAGSRCSPTAGTSRCAATLRQARRGWPT